MYRVQIDFEDRKYAGKYSTGWCQELSTVPRLGDTIFVPLEAGPGDGFIGLNHGDGEADEAMRAIVDSVAWDLDDLDEPTSAEIGESQWPQVIIGSTLQWESDNQ